jgi:hypothetical protein
MKEKLFDLLKNNFHLLSKKGLILSIPFFYVTITLNLQ